MPNITSHTFTASDGTTMTYKRREPDGFNPSQPTKLTFGLHGVGGDENTLLNEYPDDGSVCIFPSGPVVFPRLGLRGWTSDAVNTFRELYAAEQQNFNVIENNIFGHSNGAEGAALATKRGLNPAPKNLVPYSTTYDFEGASAISPTEGINIIMGYILGDGVVPEDGGVGMLPFLGILASQETYRRSVAQNISLCDVSNTSQQNGTVASYATSRIRYEDCAGDKVTDYNVYNIPGLSARDAHRWQDFYPEQLRSIFNGSYFSSPLRSLAPSAAPTTDSPTDAPSQYPTALPTPAPVAGTLAPSNVFTGAPSSAQISAAPSLSPTEPTTTAAPSDSPTEEITTPDYSTWNPTPSPFSLSPTSWQGRVTRGPSRAPTSAIKGGSGGANQDVAVAIGAALGGAAATVALAAVSWTAWKNFKSRGRVEVNDNKVVDFDNPAYDQGPARA